MWKQWFPRWSRAFLWEEPRLSVNGVKLATHHLGLNRVRNPELQLAFLGEPSHIYCSTSQTLTASLTSAPLVCWRNTYGARSAFTHSAEIPALNRAVALQSFIGLDKICRFPPGYEIQRSSAVGSQKGTPTLPSAPIPSSWSPVLDAWFEMPPCQLTIIPTSLPAGMGQVSPSSAALVQPQRIKANIHPDLTPNFRGRESLHQGLFRADWEEFWELV